MISHVYYLSRLVKSTDPGIDSVATLNTHTYISSHVLLAGLHEVLRLLMASDQWVIYDSIEEEF